MYIIRTLSISITTEEILEGLIQQANSVDKISSQGANEHIFWINHYGLFQVLLKIAFFSIGSSWRYTRWTWKRGSCFFIRQDYNLLAVGLYNKEIPSRKGLFRISRVRINLNTILQACRSEIILTYELNVKMSILPGLIINEYDRNYINYNFWLIIYNHIALQRHKE